VIPRRPRAGSGFRGRDRRIDSPFGHVHEDYAGDDAFDHYDSWQLNLP
jgi:hypothetical protein